MTPRPDLAARRSLVALARVALARSGACAVLCASPALAQSIWYVDDDARDGGDGTSWALAFRHLQDALAQSSPTDEVRVAQGLYVTDRGAGLTPGDRALYFDLGRARVLRGGYRGLAGGGSPDDRDHVLFETVLSGDLLGDDFWDPFDPRIHENAYTVVFDANGAEHTLEGLTIQSGNSNGSGGHTQVGGGLWSTNGPITVRDCTFAFCWAREGGGAFLLGASPATFERTRFLSSSALDLGAGLCLKQVQSATVRDCEFARSRESLHPWGGGIYAESTTLLVERSLFRKLFAGDGGAAHLRNSSASFVDCAFLANEAHDGAALYFKDGAYDARGCRFEANESDKSWIRLNTSSFEARECEFVANRSSTSGIVSSSLETLTVIGCRFERNFSSWLGAGIYMKQGEVRDSIFVANHSDRSGGAIALSMDAGNHVTIDGCTFTCNRASDRGGALAVFGGDASASVSSCQFAANQGVWGGAVATAGANLSVQIDECAFADNTAVGAGALWVEDTDLALRKSLLLRNSATVGSGGGGAILLLDSNAAIERCTIAENRAITGAGAGIQIESSTATAVDLRNSILWNNVTLSGNGQIQQIVVLGGTIVAEYDCIRGLDGSLGGAGNFGSNPLFWSPLRGDFHLSAGSPCIDTGDPNSLPDEDGSVADVGAFSYDPTYFLPPGAIRARLGCR